MLATGLAAGGAGCDSGPKWPPTGTAGNAGTAGAPGSGSSPAVVWDSSSRSIDLICSSYFGGSMRFAASRDQLTAEQLALLTNLRVVKPDASCIEDSLSCGLTIVQGDGSTLAINSGYGDYGCGVSAPLVAFATLQPFLDTLSCRYSKEDFSSSTPDGVVTPDVRCFDGLFIGAGGEIDLQVPVTDATSRLHVELDDCDQPGRIGNIAFTIFDTDGTTVVGTSLVPADATPDGTCAALTTTVPHAGTLKLQVSITNNPMPAGDFWLRVYQTGVAGGAGGAGGAAGTTGVAVWDDASQGLDVTCSGYYAGNMHFVASRAQLTADQLTLLSNIRTTGVDSSCGADGVSCEVTISQADASEQTWLAEEDGWCSTPRNDLISYADLKPLLDSVSCTYIRSPLPDVYVVAPDPLCFDALQTGADEPTLKVSVDDLTRPLHVELDDCGATAWAGNVSFTVFDTDGTTVLGTSTLPVDSGRYHACATVTTPVPHAGQVTVTVTSGVTSLGGAWLRAYQ